VYLQTQRSNHSRRDERAQGRGSHGVSGSPEAPFLVYLKLACHERASTQTLAPRVIAAFYVCDHSTEPPNNSPRVAGRKGDGNVIRKKQQLKRRMFLGLGGFATLTTSRSRGWKRMFGDSVRTTMSRSWARLSVVICYTSPRSSD
jgi:hypothetical protein